MTVLLMVSFIAQSVPPAAAPPEPKCKLEGQVVSASTGAPLKRASLRLSPAGAIAPGATRTTFTSSTDSDGKFVMENVDPGTYVLRADHAGFVSQSYGARSTSGAGTRLNLESGQSMKDLQFKLVPQAMIFGKVVDDDGQPVFGARIQSQRWTFFSGKRQLRPAGGGSSQADGSFVIGLQSGRVYLSAEPNRNGPMGEIEKAAGKVNDALQMTYFPNALDLASAAAIELQPGAELRGIEIHMRRGRLYDVRGHLQNTTSGPAPENANLFILPKGEEFSFGPRNQTYIPGKGGEFQFRNLLPGVYVIQTPWGLTGTTVDASGKRTTSTPLFGRVEVTVGDADVENVVVPLVPGLDITGQIKIEGDPPAQTQSAPQTYNVYLRPVDSPMGYGNTNAQASSEGNFRLEGLGPGVFRLNVSGAPDGSYVKSIRFGGEDVTNKNVDLTSGAGGEFEVVISMNAADITGTVRNENGESMAGISVQVFDGDELKKGANTDQNGSFHFTSLAPGNYHVYAWEDIEPGLSQDPDFRKNFDSKAATVKLEEKGHESVELKVIPKDAIDTEAAKVQ